MGGHIEGKWKIVRWSENRLFIWQFSRPALILIKAVFMGRERAKPYDQNWEEKKPFSILMMLSENLNLHLLSKNIIFPSNPEIIFCSFLKKYLLQVKVS